MVVLVIVLSAANVALYCGLRRQRRKRRISERELQLTLRRYHHGNGCQEMTSSPHEPSNGTLSASCGRPTAVVHGAAGYGDPSMVFDDGPCCRVPTIHTIDTLPIGERSCNQYEKLDCHGRYAAGGPAVSCAREAEWSMEECYEDIDDYMKPVIDEQC